VVFSVWEPILPTDWSKPNSRVLRRLSDTRVRQFWDAGHAVAAALKKATENGPLQPSCCENNGILWDLAAVYPPGVQWSETLPKPVFLDGAVAPMAAQLEAAMAK
jgi:hypothetical protein